MYSRMLLSITITVYNIHMLYKISEYLNLSLYLKLILHIHEKFMENVPQDSLSLLTSLNALEIDKARDLSAIPHIFVECLRNSLGGQSVIAGCSM